jgi:hypothetical protein
LINLADQLTNVGFTAAIMHRKKVDAAVSVDLE